MFQKKTIRKMTPLARKFAKLTNDAERSIIRLNKLIPEINTIESEVIAWNKRQEHFKNHGKVDPLGIWPEDSMLSKLSKERG